MMYYKEETKKILFRSEKIIFDLTKLIAIKYVEEDLMIELYFQHKEKPVQIDANKAQWKAMSDIIIEND